MVGAIDSNLDKPQSDKGSMSQDVQTNNPSASVLFLLLGDGEGGSLTRDMYFVSTILTVHD